MITEGFLGIFAGVAVATGLFLAYYFIVVKGKPRVENTVIGLLFVAIALRVGKSIAFFIFYDMVASGLAMGFLGLASMGPLLLIYIRKSISESSELNFKDYSSFVLPILGSIYCFAEAPSYNVTLAYQLGTIYSLLFIIASWKAYSKNDYTNQSLDRWTIRLLITVSAICVAYIYQHIVDTMFSYALGAGFAGLALYYIFGVALSSPVVFSKTMKPITDNKSLNRVKKGLEIDQLYLEPGITLNQFAERVDVPAYLVSQTVKELYDKSFPEIINFFRIEEIKNKLLENSNLKIEALAYEVGFNTPSAFYAAFKKYTGVSPKAYLQEQVLKTA